MKHLQVKLDDILNMQFKSWLSAQGVTIQNFIKELVIDFVFDRALLAGLYVKVRKEVASCMVEGRAINLEKIMDDIMGEDTSYTPFYKELSEKFFAIPEVYAFAEDYCRKHNIPHMGNVKIEAQKNSQQGVFRKAFVLAYIYLKLKDEYPDLDL